MTDITNSELSANVSQLSTEINCGIPYRPLLLLTLSHFYSESKKIPPYGFLKFFPKLLGIFNQFFLHTYYVMISTLDYKFLFNYLQL